MAIFPCAVSVRPNDWLVWAVRGCGVLGGGGGYNSSQSASNHSVLQFLVAIQSRVPF